MAYITLSEAEMLRRWRLLTALEPLALEDGEEAFRQDGADIDTLCLTRLRAWYLDLLDHGPEELLVVRDVCPRASLSLDEATGGTLVSFPTTVRRLLSIRFPGWLAPAVPLVGDEAREALRRAANPFLRGGDMSPVVVALAPAEVLVLSPLPADAAPSLARAITLPPEEGTYELEERALATINNQQLTVNS